MTALPVVSGRQAVKALEKMGYAFDRQLNSLVYGNGRILNAGRLAGDLHLDRLWQRRPAHNRPEGDAWSAIPRS